MVDLPSFFAPTLHYFGISIDRTSLHAVEIDSKGTVHSSAEVIFSEEPFVKGQLAEKEIFVSGLRKLIETGKFSTKFVSVCFPEAYAYTRGLTIPNIPLTEISEAVSWQVKDLFPLPEDKIYYDWRIIEELPHEYTLAVVAIQKHTLDALIDALTSVGLHPVRFESGALVIARLLVLPTDRYAIVTDINQHGTSVTLVRGEKTIFTTVVNHSIQEAESLYVQHIGNTVSDVVGFYQKKFSFDDKNLNIIVTGEKATDAWIQSMRSLFPYPIKILQTAIHNPAYNKPYAAATLHIAPPSDAYTINLLPAYLQELYDKKQLEVFYCALFGRMALGIGVLCLLLLFVFGVLTFAEYRLGQTTLRLGWSKSEDRVLVNKMRDIESQAKDVLALSPLRKTPREKIEKILSLLPESIQLTQWEYDDAKLQFNLVGIARTRETLIGFKNALEVSDDFSNITLPLGSLESSASAHFELTFVTKQ